MNINLSDKTIIQKINLILTILIMIAVMVVGINYIFFGGSLQGSTPYTFSIASGSSMDPVFDSGCSILFSKKYTNQTLEEGDVVTYYDKYSNVYITHKIIKKYDEYDPKTANHIIKSIGDTNKGQFVYYKGDRVIKMRTEQPPSRTANLKGKTVYILKGVGNNIVDPKLVTEDQIKEIVYTNTYIEIADNKDFCRNTGPAKLSQLDIKIHYH